MLLWHLVVREVGSQFASVRFRIAVLVVIGLTLLAVSLGLQDYETRQAHFTEQTSDLRRPDPMTRISTIYRTPDPNLRVYRAPSPTAILARGIEPSLPSYWDFGAAGVVTGPPDVSSFQRADPGFILDLEALVRIVLAFLAITVAVEVVAGDRAAGTLAAILAQPVNHLTILASKYIGGLVTLGAVLILPAAFACLYVWLRSREVFTEIAALTPVFFGLSLVYLATQFAIGIAIASAIRWHRRALTVSLTVWALVALGGPQMVFLISRTMISVSSRDAVEASLKGVSEKRDAETKLALGIAAAEFWAAPNLPPALERPMEDTLQAELQQTRQMLDEIEEPWNARRSLQARLERQLSWVLPSTAYRQAMELFTNTGRSAEATWDSAIRTRQQLLRIGLFDNPPAYNLKMPEGGLGNFRRREQVMVGQLVPFQPPTQKIHDRARDAAPELISMATHLILAVLVAAAVFPRVGF